MRSAQDRPSKAAGPYRTWSAYGGGPEQIRFSRLDQINRRNVQNLERAWTYDSGESGGLQTQPIVVDGVLYAVTPTHKVFALRAATGEQLWRFDSGIRAQGPNRGLMYWSDGRDDKRVYAAVNRYVYALDVRTGKPIPHSARPDGSTFTGISAAIQNANPLSSRRLALCTRIS